jgi:hypothetical protein
MTASRDPDGRVTNACLAARGDRGFGYDPMFVPVGSEQTSVSSNPSTSTVSATAPTPSANVAALKE